MTILQPLEKLFSLNARGRYGFGRGYGGSRYGHMRYGGGNTYAGIYQKKYTNEGIKVSRMAFYRPTNPRTELQQSWRAVFASGWVAYNALTPEEKALLLVEARVYHLSSAQLFMKRWLKSHRL